MRYSYTINFPKWHSEDLLASAVGRPLCYKLKREYGPAQGGPERALGVLSVSPDPQDPQLSESCQSETKRLGPVPLYLQLVGKDCPAKKLCLQRRMFPKLVFDGVLDGCVGQQVNTTHPTDDPFQKTHKIHCLPEHGALLGGPFG